MRTDGQDKANSRFSQFCERTRQQLAADLGVGCQEIFAAQFLLLVIHYTVLWKQQDNTRQQQKNT